MSRVLGDLTWNDYILLNLVLTVGLVTTTTKWSLNKTLVPITKHQFPVRKKAYRNKETCHTLGFEDTFVVKMSVFNKTNPEIYYSPMKF